MTRTRDAFRENRPRDSDGPRRLHVVTEDLCTFFRATTDYERQAYVYLVLDLVRFDVSPGDRVIGKTVLFVCGTARGSVHRALSPDAARTESSERKRRSSDGRTGYPSARS